MALAPWFRSTRMNRKNNVRSGASATAVMALAMLTALVTNAAASNPNATGSNPSPESYLADYPAPPQSAAPAIETAQAAQSQNLLPEYAPPPPPQGARHQTLTLPQLAPQLSSAPGPAVELPRSQGGEGALEVPIEVPIERQPQSTVGRISVTATDGTGRWIQD